MLQEDIGFDVYKTETFPNSNTNKILNWPEHLGIPNIDAETFFKEHDFVFKQVQIGIFPPVFLFQNGKSRLFGNHEIRYERVADIPDIIFNSNLPEGASIWIPADMYNFFSSESYARVTLYNLDSETGKFSSTRQNYAIG